MERQPPQLSSCPLEPCLPRCEAWVPGLPILKMEKFGNLNLCKTPRFLIDHFIVTEHLPCASRVAGAEDTEPYGADASPCPCIPWYSALPSSRAQAMSIAECVVARCIGGCYVLQGIGKSGPGDFQGEGCCVS